MWRGLPNTIAGKAANNHFYCLGVLISHTIPVEPKMEGLYMHGKTFHINYSIFQSKEKYCLTALDARFSHDAISREMPVPSMTVSGITFLLSLSPPSN
jgi:hypothetical protein